MIKLYGNEIWNSNTPNQYKKVIIASESQFESITDALENAGLNYCGYINKNKSYVAVGRATVPNLEKLNISYDSIFDSNNRKYVTNNIIGTTKYNDIGDKMYRKYNTDFAYKVAQRLSEQDIPFSGKIFGKNTTITVDNIYKDAINAIAHEIREQRELLYNDKAVEKNEPSATVKNSVTVSKEDNTENLFNALSVLHYKAHQLESLNSTVELLNNHPELIDTFSTMFEDTSDFKPEQLNMLSMNFVKTYSGLSDSELILANTADFNEIKQSFINTNLADKLIENHGYSYAQSELIRDMVDMGIDYDTINLLDYTFSLTEMQTFIGAYSRSDYDSLINLVSKVKGVTRSEMEGMISDGTYTPALPDFNTLEKTLYFQESEAESITYMYYNPDAYSGGQFVITEVSYKRIAEANKEYGDDFSGFFDFLDTTGEQRLIDIGSESFRTAVKKFYSGTEFAEGLNADIQHKLVELAVVPEIKLPEVRKIELIKVDEDKLNSDPFIQQVMADAESDAGALNVSSEEIVNQFNSENEIVPINEPEQTEPVQEIIRPTITCDWSESPVFENGKTYSVSEFDKLMKNADDEWVEQRQLEIEEYGSENAVTEAYRNGELDNIHLGYEKTKFIINMPNGTKYTERQDIGDGNGGIIDFLNQYPQYSGVVKILEADIKLDKGENEKAADLPITESKERDVRSDEKLQSVDELTVEVENAAPSRAEKAEPPTLFDMVESSEQTETSVNDEKAKNYVIEDREAVTGAKTKFQNNIAAIKILKQTEAENRAATPEEQGQLFLYSGWGGLANAFESDNDKWKNEYSELKGLLTDEEYTAARSTVLDSFYTDTAIVDSIYEVIRNAGFEDGNILEPAMGVGNFFGRLPEELRDKVNLYGVEKDSLSGRIAQKLYPQADITIDGFENTRFNDNSFDVAIGNIPFGDFSVNDSKYNSKHLKIHDYFFLKSLDKVRDGGIVAFVTSKGTLDKKDSSFRKTLAERADLVGAVRLPNNAFKSAGTEVTADIIFLQKREKKSEIEPSWVHTGQLENGLTVNNYFVEHPEMILGEVVEGNKMFGRTDDTMCVPFNDGRTLSELLSSAVKNINFEYSASAEKLIPVSEHLTAEPLKLRLQSFYRRNGEIYFYGSNKSGKIVNVSADKALGKKLNHERINSFIDIRDTLRELLDVQQYDNKDSEIAQLQEKLNNCYDSFYSKYGLLHSSYNHSLLNSDGAYPLVASLEADFAKDNNLLVKKSDIFTERVNKPTATINHVDTAEEALAVCVAEKGVIDFEYMSQITDVPPEDLKIGLREKGEIFAVPSYTGDEDYEYQTASEYLSGDIYAKLDMAKAYASVNGIYESNVVALKEVLPTPLKAGDIDINLGATWIDKKYYEQFMYEIFETPQSLKSDYVSRFFKSDRIELDYSEYSGRWNITNKRADLSVTTVKTYGASGLSAYQIFESVLNLSEPKVYKDKVDEYGVVERDKNNKPVRVLDVEATQVVQQKANAIRREFKNWIFKDANRRRDIVDTYNRTFNCVHAREYDGSHLNFPGMNSNIQLHEHQKNAIAHAIYGGNTLFAHSVGAGKTFEMIATAMECKRLGLCHKSLFAVPNHLTEQVGADFLKLYPNANILVATKDDFKSSNRKMLMSKIATGNYDAVIIGHTQLKMLPLSPERQEAFLQSQIDDIVAGLAEKKAQDGNKFTVKEMERTKKNLENQLEKLQSSKKDNTVYFEELGIDKLFVDEAHEFKNLYCATKLQNVSGISSRASQRATELFAKCRYLDEKTGGKGVVFATGTPLSNSVTELHTMMRYLNYDFLASHNNMQNFDNWISAFGVQKKEYELAPAGNKFKERTRIAEYSNLPELMSMFKMVADVKTAETLKLKVPDCELHIVDVEPTELQKELVDELSDRADEVNSGSVDPSQDNMLKITGDGRKLGLDPRLISPDFEDNPNTKLNVCVNNVFDIYTDTAKDKLTQIVFCDLGVPSKNTGNDSSKEQNDNKSVAEIDSLEETGKFCVYDDIRDKLIAKGIPATEIAYIHNAKTEAQKSELFSKVRSGEVRILLGSTGKMGTGTNVQDRIIALHDLDVPWRPADLEQRRGRMVRQGNINEKVHLYRYVTKGTFDAYSYQLLETKQKFISQVMTDKAPARKCADVDQAALSYGEIKALCTGDDRIREKLTLDNRVKELNSLKADYNNTKYELEDAVAAYPEKRKQLLCTIGNIKSDIDNVKSFVDKDGKLICKLTLGSQTFNLKNDEERKNAAKALTTAVAQVRIADNRKKQVSVGNICGFDISVINNGNVYDDIVVTIKGKYSYSAQLGVSAVHNLSKIEGLLYKTESVLDYSQNSLNKLDLDYKTSVALLEKPFEYEAELQEKSARLSELTKILNIELAHQKTESKPKTHYFGKDKILGRNKSSKQLQNKTVMKSEPKRSEQEL